jgi:deoxyhypusine synthase
LFDGSFESVEKFMDKHKYSWGKQDDALKLVSENLERVLIQKDFELEKNEISFFMKISSKLMKKGLLGFGQFKKYLIKIKEVDIDVANTGTLEPDIESQ